MLADEDVVVFGLDMRDAAVGALEEVGADRRIDQTLGIGEGSREQGQCEHGRAAPHLWKHQQEARKDPGEAERERDRTRADRRNQEERGPERPDDAAQRRNAVDRAGHPARLLRRLQQQANAERRVHPEKRDRKEQDRERGRETAAPYVVGCAQHALEQRLRKRRERQDIGRADQHGRAQHSGGRVAVRRIPADEIADAEGCQHGRDQRGPGVDAAAEIRVEIARAEHLEAHDDRAGDEGNEIDDGGKGPRGAARLNHGATLAGRRCGRKRGCRSCGVMAATIMLRIVLALLVIAMFSPAHAQNRDQALIGAAGKGDLAAVERLIREGASVAARDSRGRTALLVATHGNHVPVARVL